MWGGTGTRFYLEGEVLDADVVRFDYNDPVLDEPRVEHILLDDQKKSRDRLLDVLLGDLGLVDQLAVEADDRPLLHVAPHDVDPPLLQDLLHVRILLVVAWVSQPLDVALNLLMKRG